MFESMVNKITYPRFFKSLKGGLRWIIDEIKRHLDLNKLKNKKALGFHPVAVAKFGLAPEDIPQSKHAEELDFGLA